MLSWREPYGPNTHVRFEREGEDGDVLCPIPIAVFTEGTGGEVRGPAHECSAMKSLIHVACSK